MMALFDSGERDLPSWLRRGPPLTKRKGRDNGGVRPRDELGSSHSQRQRLSPFLSGERRYPILKEAHSTATVKTVAVE